VFSIALLIYNVLKTFFVWKKLGLQPFSKGTLRAIFMGVAITALVFFLPKISSPYIDTLLRSGVIVALFVGFVYWLRPSKDISHYINETLKKKKLF
jgi:hypothetical protein